MAVQPGQLACDGNMETLSSYCQAQPLLEASLDFRGRGLGMLVANPFPSEIAGQIVEAQPNRKPLFPRHAAVSFQLFFKCSRGVHDDFLRC